MACCMVAQSNTWIDVDLSSVISGEIRLMAISQEQYQPPIIKFGLKIAYIWFKSPKGQWINKGIKCW